MLCSLNAREGRKREWVAQSGVTMRIGMLVTVDHVLYCVHGRMYGIWRMARVHFFSHEAGVKVASTEAGEE